MLYKLSPSKRNVCKSALYSIPNPPRSLYKSSVYPSKYMESMNEALMEIFEEVPDHNKIVMMNEGQEEEITEMIESLMSGDVGLKQNNEEIIQSDEEEDGSNKIMVQQEAEEVKGRRNNVFAGVDYLCSAGKDYWWEAYALASGTENYTDYNWCFEDEYFKMWEWSECFAMPELIECKPASEA